MALQFTNFVKNLPTLKMVTFPYPDEDFQAIRLVVWSEQAIDRVIVPDGFVELPKYRQYTPLFTRIFQHIWDGKEPEEIQILCSGIISGEVNFCILIPGVEGFIRAIS